MSGYTEKSKYELQHLLTQYQIYSEPYKSNAGRPMECVTLNYLCGSLTNKKNRLVLG